MLNNQIIITIKFLSTLKSVYGIETDTLSVEFGTKLSRLLEIVQNKYFRRNVASNTSQNDINLIIQDTSGNIKLADEVFVLVNDIDFKLFGKELELPLEDGDEIVLISSVHGG